MTRDEWKAAHSSLRYRLRQNPKTEMVSRTITANGKDYDIRIFRRNTYPTRYHELQRGTRITRPTIIDRHWRQRWAEEMQVAQIDREIARKSRRPLDRRAYKAGIDYARDLRTAP